MARTKPENVEGPEGMACSMCEQPTGGPHAAGCALSAPFTREPVPGYPKAAVVLVGSLWDGFHAFGPVVLADADDEEALEERRVSMLGDQADPQAHVEIVPVVSFREHLTNVPTPAPSVRALGLLARIVALGDEYDARDGAEGAATALVSGLAALVEEARALVQDRDA